MKAIIDGKRYNTETATEIGSASRGNYPGDGDFSSWFASLYRTKSGRYFLAGEGGGLSRFAHHCHGGGRCGGEAIQPLDWAEAVDWAEQYLTTDEIEAAFGDKLEEA